MPMSTEAALPIPEVVPQAKVECVDQEIQTDDL